MGVSCKWRIVTMDSGFVVSWGTLALINAGIAQCQGRRGLIWFLISLLLGPIATFLIVVMENHN